MAVRVIIQGETQPTIYEGRCPQCKCVIQCLKEDFFFDGDPCGTGTVKCPTPNCPKVICIENCKLVVEKSEGPNGTKP